MFPPIALGLGGVGQLLGGGLSGGVSSSLFGGNFWDGARDGLIVSGLNYLSHGGDEMSEEDWDRYQTQNDPTLHLKAISALFDLTIGSVRSAGNGIATGIKWSFRGLRNWRLAKGGYATFSAYKKAFGVAGKGKAWHHIVEQHAGNIAEFGAEAIHNPRNLVALENGAGQIHRQITGYYNSIQPFTNATTVRSWVKTQSYSQQYDFGVSVMRRFGWTP